ncbi:NAD(P)/FAD-dependent oxidoreductase [Streptomyces sp. NRRL WC-3742]|uniref:NAD(P)/FAD-dependent oxidoreductase n=1 Tax=Streptomyces sp. NRRL WC-3742 TaxID=1463934 RepID=UPI00099B93F7|nr:FAD-dependent oxidoreductase [Streptomyces sp. NRRL WC-3742]
MGDTPGRGAAGTKRHIGRRCTIRVLIAGGGCAGMAAALHLQRGLRERLRSGEVEITVVEPEAYFTYHPLLAEVAAGSIDPRHVVVPLRRVLPDCRVLTARITRIEHATRRAFADAAGPGEPPAPVELPYDLLVVAPGSVSRGAPVPGLAEHGRGFSTVGDAVSLRNHVLEQLDLASATRDPALRQAALTFVFVGAGYAGVGALAELEDMARTAVRDYHNVDVTDLRWVLAEATDRILAEESPELAEHTLRELRERGVDVRLGTTLASAADQVVALSDGSRFAARTLVWTAGVRPAPMLRDTDLPLDALGRVRCLATLQAVGPDGRALPGVWAAGDCAAVPDPNANGDPCAPNAQHAFAQAELLARNLVLALDAGPYAPGLAAYEPGPASCSTSLGIGRAVAHTRRGARITGRRAWWLHRARHLRRLPSAERRVRVLMDWVLGGVFSREVVSLGGVEYQRSGFEEGFEPGPGRPPGAGPEAPR